MKVLAVSWKQLKITIYDIQWCVYKVSSSTFLQWFLVTFIGQFSYCKLLGVENWKLVWIMFLKNWIIQKFYIHLDGFLTESACNPQFR